VQIEGSGFTFKSSDVSGISYHCRTLIEELTKNHFIQILQHPKLCITNCTWCLYMICIYKPLKTKWNSNWESNQDGFPSLAQFFISKVIFSDLDYPPSCTFLGHTLKLCKDLLIVIRLFRKTCSYEKYGTIDRQVDCNLTPKTVLRGLYKKKAQQLLTFIKRHG